MCTEIKKNKIGKFSTPGLGLGAWVSEKCKKKTQKSGVLTIGTWVNVTACHIAWHLGCHLPDYRTVKTPLARGEKNEIVLSSCVIVHYRTSSGAIPQTRQRYTLYNTLKNFACSEGLSLMTGTLGAPSQLAGWAYLGLLQWVSLAKVLLLPRGYQVQSTRVPTAHNLF